MPRRGDYDARCPDVALERFKQYCRFEPETGCVVWTGGRTMGRGHHDPYPAFWFAGKRWFGHRWSAKYIHGVDIDGFQVDHFCPYIAKPNTLCVQHVQGLTPRLNRQLQETRKMFVYLQVGLLNYEDVYGAPSIRDENTIPFYPEPAWLKSENSPHDPDACPF